MTLGNLTGISALADVETRSISAENPTGEPGQGGRRTEGTGAHAARDLGQGWKVSPSIEIAPGETVTLADIAGSGCITHIWLTTHVDHWRRLVLRAFWDGDAAPAIETPVGDFFCSGWGKFAQVNSLPVAVNPNGGFNCYWEMPFQTQAQLTIENTHDEAGGRVLPGGLLAGRRAGQVGVPARAVAPEQPAAFQDGAHVAGRCGRARGTTSAPTWPGASTAPAGGVRAR